MCGRYAFTKTEGKKLKERFRLKKIPKDLKPRYNISPTQDVPVILNVLPQEITMVRWGLIPHWAKDENLKYSMINAKAETITEKPTYRGPIKSRRCLVIADSFYEWKKAEGTKQPYRIFLKNEELFAFAGIWDCWKKDDKMINSCSIITIDPNEMMSNIHDRMPVILPPEKEEEWLSAVSVDKALKLLNAYDEKKMEAYEISTLVNSPSNNTQEVLNPV